MPTQYPNYIISYYYCLVMGYILIYRLINLALCQNNFHFHLYQTNFSPKSFSINLRINFTKHYFLQPNTTNQKIKISSISIWLDFSLRFWQQFMLLQQIFGSSFSMCVLPFTQLQLLQILAVSDPDKLIWNISHLIWKNIYVIYLSRNAYPSSHWKNCSTVYCINC